MSCNPCKTAIDFSGKLPTRYTLAQVTPYVHRAGAVDWAVCYVTAVLQVNRIIYGGNYPISTADLMGSACDLGQGHCEGQGVSNTSGSLENLGLKVGLSAIPIVGGLLAGLSGMLGIGAHAKNLATEYATLCGVAAAWNAWADSQETMIKNGKLPLQDAITQLQSAHDTMVGHVRNQEKATNGYKGMHYALDALLYFNKEIVYPSLIPSMLSGLTGKGLAIAGGIGLAKIAGVF